MAKIFLSYRRQDSAAVALWIDDRLRAHFGDDAIFMDLDSIPFGVDFRQNIASALDQCAVLVAVIGRNWAGEPGAHRRIDDPRDFVRIEIEAALERNLPVIPVLIDRAPMPGEADLPPSLAQLAYLNAAPVDVGRDFKRHVDRLIRGIELHLGRVPSAAPTQDRPREAAARLAVPQSPPPLPDRERSNSIGMRLVRIEPGSFQMGTTKEQIDQLLRLLPELKREWFEDEQPQHPVKITRPFYLGTHPVTQGQYKAIMGSTPSHFKGSDDLPVESVSWLDAVSFCNKMSEKDKRTPFYRINGTDVADVGGNGYRLPTEAEWEYACRAGMAGLFPWGDDIGKQGEHVWISDNSDSKTHPVGQKRPNAWGLYDMLGNVWEWCADWYDEKYYASSPSVTVDPPGPPKASSRVLRGGSWVDDARGVRAACRYHNVPSNRGYNPGLPLCRSPGINWARSHREEAGWRRSGADADHADEGWRSAG